MIAATSPERERVQIARVSASSQRRLGYARTVGFVGDEHPDGSVGASYATGPRYPTRAIQRDSPYAFQESHERITRVVHLDRWTAQERLRHAEPMTHRSLELRSRSSYSHTPTSHAWTYQRSLRPHAEVYRPSSEHHERSRRASERVYLVSEPYTESTFRPLSRRTQQYWPQPSPTLHHEKPPIVATPSMEGVARLAEVSKRVLSPAANLPRKKPKQFDKLDLLCSATLEMGPLHDNPLGCSCPKSKCVALYCDCFKAGRRCDPKTCSCMDCKNTVGESGRNGARTKAIRNILARNPRAFKTAGLGNPLHKLPKGEVACNCIRSRCLKLYCTCFQAGKACDPAKCTCVSCLNTTEDAGGHRKQAIQQCLEKRPDAFKTRVREPGLGCACKNNRCIRKYCECFRTNRLCTSKCSCRLCANMEVDSRSKSPPTAVVEISNIEDVANGRIQN